MSVIAWEDRLNWGLVEGAPLVLCDPCDTVITTAWRITTNGYTALVDERLGRPFRLAMTVPDLDFEIATSGYPQGGAE